jgi:hypothetical protein
MASWLAHNCFWSSNSGFEPSLGRRPSHPRLVTREGEQDLRVAIHPNGPADGVRQAVVSAENQEALSKFLKSSVQPSTNRKYELKWEWFAEFMKEKGSSDPFMRELTQQERAAMVSLFMICRHVQGKRGKAATAATAAIRLRFSQEMLDTSFLDSAVVFTARSACLPNPCGLTPPKGRFEPATFT